MALALRASFAVRARNPAHVIALGLALAVSNPVFGGVNWQDGGALKGFIGGQIGLRYTW